MRSWTGRDVLTGLRNPVGNHVGRRSLKRTGNSVLRAPVFFIATPTQAPARSVCVRGLSLGPMPGRAKNKIGLRRPWRGKRTSEVSHKYSFSLEGNRILLSGYWAAEPRFQCVGEPEFFCSETAEWTNATCVAESASLFSVFPNSLSRLGLARWMIFSGGGLYVECFLPFILAFLHRGDQCVY